jgi:GDP-4-dehydro-6-deoxy-D-mannose reductase
MAKALISGCNGFVGPHLAAELTAHGRTVYGFDRAPRTSVPGLTYTSLDMQDCEAVTRFVTEVKPDEAYHCAGISSPPQADASPCNAISTNIMGTVFLLDAVRSVSPRAKVLLVGSAKEYGECDFPQVTEQQPSNPDDVYGVSKYAAELIGAQYFKQYRIDVRFTRSYNHSGPGQSPFFVCSDWSKQVAEICQGKREPQIEVGALDTAIDFCDVRDVVKAYRLILEKGRPGEVYNVCSSKAIALKDILDYLVKKAGRTVRVVVNPDKIPKNNKPAAIKSGSYAKLEQETGWKPSIDIFKTLDDLYAYWLKKI